MNAESRCPTTAKTRHRCEVGEYRVSLQVIGEEERDAKDPDAGENSATSDPPRTRLINRRIGNNGSWIAVASARTHQEPHRSQAPPRDVVAQPVLTRAGSRNTKKSRCRAACEDVQVARPPCPGDEERHAENGDGAKKRLMKRHNARRPLRNAPPRAADRGTEARWRVDRKGLRALLGSQTSTRAPRARPARARAKTPWTAAP